MLPDKKYKGVGKKAKEVVDAAGLSWNKQTSSNPGRDGYNTAVGIIAGILLIIDEIREYRKSKEIKQNET